MDTNYSKHASVWDWDDYDRSDEFEFWYKMSKRYGMNILSAMGAIGLAGEYMARKGCSVTVLDYTREMVEEGIKRFKETKGLEFVHADICDFKLDKHFDFCFISSSDIHLLNSLEDVKKALIEINRHLSENGGLGLNLLYPYGQSHKSPMRRFDPRVPKDNGKVIWKEGESSYDVDTKKQEIHQVVYVKEGDCTDSFDHYVTLQLYDKDVLFEAIRECGFDIAGEYCDYEFNKSEIMNSNCYVECKKRRDV